MKNKRIIILASIISLAAATSFAFWRFSTAPEKAPKHQYTDLLDTVIEATQKWHYNSLTLDDGYSQRVFDLYLKRLDSNKGFFLKEDIQKFTKHQQDIDDQLQSNQLHFFDEANAIFDQRIEEVEKMSHQILTKAFDFSVEEDLELDAKKREYSQNANEQREYWRKMLKYRTLLRYHNIQDSDDQTQSPFSAKIESQAREKILDSMQRRFRRMKNEEKPERIHTFIDAMLAAQDPHTSYFPPASKENFDISMTGRLEGIGAVLKEEEGYIKVVQIVTGSAAWRQKQLKAEDIILKVAQGKGEPVDIVDARVGDAVKLIRGKKGSEVRLTVKKPDGSIVVIPIIRDEVIIEDSYAKSVIIKHRSLDKKIGYIYLPKFYHDFKKTGSRNSSDDIKNEIDKLKGQQPEAIILDLRHNSGGALDDAIKMAGLLINKGPIVQVQGIEQHSAQRQRKIFEDPNPGISYRGPVAVMINTLSASASEIVAGALQDYQRAIIIGSKSSFGKGTVQSLLSLDKIRQNRQNQWGTLKLTIQKFYRINGGSTQFKGVIPDIILPDIYSQMNIGEKELEYALPWDQIGSAKFETWPADKIKLEVLQQKSQQRVANSDSFQKVEQYIQRQIKQREKSRQTLNFKQFVAEQEKLKQESEKYNASFQVISDLVVTPIAGQGESKHQDWYETISKDHYIEETIQVLNDYSQMLAQ